MKKRGENAGDGPNGAEGKQGKGLTPSEAHLYCVVEVGGRMCARAQALCETVAGLMLNKCARAF
eukprot:806045-Pelagomonas_calceolata.AAC.9